MKIKIARQNYDNLLVQRFDDDDEPDDAFWVSHTELLAMMQFVKNEINGDWADVIEYLTDRNDQV